MADADWTDPLRAEGYLAAADVRVPWRREAYALIGELLADIEARRIADLGGGGGDLAHALLTRFPGMQVEWLDCSEAMEGAARQCLAPFGERVRFLRRDLGDPGWADGLPTGLDAVVASLVAHHLPDGRKPALFREVLGLLRPGGLFLLYDPVLPATPSLRERAERLTARYEAARRRARSEAVTDEAVASERAERRRRTGSQPASLTDQMRWLAQAGFVEVECWGRYLAHCLFGGYSASTG
jgi:tRNA (cmo5U34)-methyltransferase